MSAKSILIVDDEASVRESLEKVLSKAGYLTLSASSGNEAWSRLPKEKVDIVLSDLKRPDGDGVDLLKRIKNNVPDIAVSLLTGYGTIQTARTEAHQARSETLATVKEELHQFASRMTAQMGQVGSGVQQQLQHVGQVVGA